MCAAHSIIRRRRLRRRYAMQSGDCMVTDDTSANYTFLQAKFYYSSSHVKNTEAQPPAAACVLHRTLLTLV